MVGLSEIELSVRNIDDATVKWRAATGSNTSPIALTEEIALKLLVGERNLVRALTFEVHSLDVAATFLAAKNLLATRTERELVLSLAATDGLRFKLVEVSREPKLGTELSHS